MAMDVVAALDLVVAILQMAMVVVVAVDFVSTADVAILPMVTVVGVAVDLVSTADVAILRMATVAIFAMVVAALDLVAVAFDLSCVTMLQSTAAAAPNPALAAATVTIRWCDYYYCYSNFCRSQLFGNDNSSV